MARKRSGGVPHGALTPRAPVLLLTIIGQNLFWEWTGENPVEWTFIADGENTGATSEGFKRNDLDADSGYATWGNAVLQIVGDDGDVTNTTPVSNTVQFSPP